MVVRTAGNRGSRKPAVPPLQNEPPMKRVCYARRSCAGWWHQVMREDGQCIHASSPCDRDKTGCPENLERGGWSARLIALHAPHKTEAGADAPRRQVFSTNVIGRPSERSRASLEDATRTVESTAGDLRPLFILHSPNCVMGRPRRTPCPTVPANCFNQKALRHADRPPPTFARLPPWKDKRCRGQQSVAQELFARSAREQRGTPGKAPYGQLI